jgi:acetylornithine deacetylase/succinyl-diaminopimelate desuccinylase-like protein
LDWKSLQNEVVGYLQDLIRINTTNPPGNEILAAEYLAGVLRMDGLEPLILESEPGRANLISRIRGTGEEGPLLLSGHIDVVAAEPEFWQHDPFGGEIADGYIWGRGALDMKGMVAAELMVMLLLNRTQRPLKRDVIFMANADEERSSRLGAAWVADHHRDLIRAEYAFNEGDGRAVKIGGRTFYFCETAEKGMARFRMCTRGLPGHGSRPRDDNAVVRLAELVARLGRTDLPLRATETVRRFLDGISEAFPPDIREQLPDLWDPARHREVLAALPIDDNLRRRLYAMVRNTVTPTVLCAGSKVNVIPSVAEALVDGRTLPGVDTAQFLSEVRQVTGDEVHIEFTEETPPVESAVESPLFDIICEVMAEYEPGATVVPSLVTGATDAKSLSRLGIKTYGFFPSRYDPSAFEGVHGHNERVSIDNLLFGTRVLNDIVVRFCSC